MIDPTRIRELLEGGEIEQVLAEVPMEEIAAAWCRYTERSMATEDGLEWDDDPDRWAAELRFELSSSNETWSETDE